VLCCVDPGEAEFEQLDGRGDPRPRALKERMSWRVFLPVPVLVLVFAASCAHGIRWPERGGPSWVRLTSANFEVRTDLAEAQARPVVQELEDLRASLLTVAWHDVPPPPRRLKVYLLRNSAELRELAGNFIAGFVAPGFRWRPGDGDHGGAEPRA